jgi:hypothetical protein
MLATTSNTIPRRKSAALEAMLSNLDTAGDLLSGSECSSLATSPIHEDVFTFESQSRGRQPAHNEKSPLALRSPDPIDVVRNVLNRISGPDVAEEFFAEDAKVECHSVMVRGEGRKKVTAQEDLDDLLASCLHRDIEIDSIFACGENVAAFGHFVYSNGPSGLIRDMHFSIWACVDVVREKIVKFRWLDQVVRAGDDRADKQG